MNIRTLLHAYPSGPESVPSSSQKACWTLCSICCWRVWKGMLKLSPSALSPFLLTWFNHDRWRSITLQWTARPLWQSWDKTGQRFCNHEYFLQTTFLKWCYFKGASREEGKSAVQIWGRESQVSTFSNFRCHLSVTGTRSRWRCCPQKL